MCVCVNELMVVCVERNLTVYIRGFRKGEILVSEYKHQILIFYMKMVHGYCG